MTCIVREGRLFSAPEGVEETKNLNSVFGAGSTPTHRIDGYAELSDVCAAAEEIFRLSDGFTMIVNKSTLSVYHGFYFTSVGCS